MNSDSGLYRWHNVPFVMKAGKALNERKTEVRIQYKPPTAPIHADAETQRNELVVGLWLLLDSGLYVIPTAF